MKGWNGSESSDGRAVFKETTIMKLVAPAKKVQRTVRLEIDVWESVLAVAKENNMKPSTVLRHLVIAGLLSDVYEQ